MVGVRGKRNPQITFRLLGFVGVNLVYVYETAVTQEFGHDYGSSNSLVNQALEIGDKLASQWKNYSI